MSFYETLVLAMELNGIKPAELAEKTGFHPSFFSKLKSGHTKDVTWEKALIIISALGMTPDEFLQLGNKMEGD